MRSDYIHGETLNPQENYFLSETLTTCTETPVFYLHFIST